MFALCDVRDWSRLLTSVSRTVTAPLLWLWLFIGTYLPQFKLVFPEPLIPPDLLSHPFVSFTPPPSQSAIRRSAFELGVL
jgi:hypothetical protein